jgi:hypothetical protein
MKKKFRLFERDWYVQCFIQLLVERNTSYISKAQKESEHL